MLDRAVRVTGRVGADEGGAVGDAEADERVTDDAMEGDGLVDGERAAEEGRADPREQPTHDGQEQDGAVEVDAGAEGATEAHELVGGQPGARAREAVGEEPQVRRDPEDEDDERAPAVLEERRAERGGRAVDAREDVLVRRDPLRLAPGHGAKDGGVLADDGLELLEVDASVAVRVGRDEERAGDGVGGLRGPVGDVALGEAHRDHAIELVAGERAVAVVIVHAEGEHQLLLIASGDELADALHELVLGDDAVGVQVEGAEHTACEVLAAEAERGLELLDVDDAVGAGRACERALEGRDEPRVDGDWAGNALQGATC